MRLAAASARDCSPRGAPAVAGDGGRGRGLDAARGRRGHAGRRRAHIGTIGGGRLEWTASPAPAQLLAGGAAESQRRHPARPAVGQCCGGHVTLRLRRAGAAELAEHRGRGSAAAAAPCRRVLLFGAGHVGRALAAALAPLPLRLRWIDDRADEFPAEAARRPSRSSSPTAPLAEIARAPPGAAVFVLTHSHALDFALCSAVLGAATSPMSA